MKVISGYKIRFFGNDVLCASTSALIETLKTKYAGKSVAIHYLSRTTRMIGPVFVDVSPDGEVTGSYGENKPIDFTALESKAYFSTNQEIPEGRELLERKALECCGSEDYYALSDTMGENSDEVLRNVIINSEAWQAALSEEHYE